MNELQITKFFKIGSCYRTSLVKKLRRLKRTLVEQVFKEIKKFGSKEFRILSDIRVYLSLLRNLEVTDLKWKKNLFQVFKLICIEIRNGTSLEFLKALSEGK